MMLKTTTVMGSQLTKLAAEWGTHISEPIKSYKQTHLNTTGQLKTQTGTILPNLAKEIGSLYNKILASRDKIENPESPQRVVDENSMKIMDLVKQKHPLEERFTSKQPLCDPRHVETDFLPACCQSEGRNIQNYGQTQQIPRTCGQDCVRG